MIITITLNPAMDKTVTIPGFAVDKVNRVNNIRLDPGGKGINVCKVVAALGGESLAMGFLGGNTGHAILQMLRQMKIDTDFEMIEGETRTNLKVVDPVGKTYTDINEPGPLVTQDEIEALEKRLFGRIRAGDIVVLAGGAPKAIPAKLLNRWTQHCKELGAWVYADLDGELLVQTVEAVPYFVKPNDAELSYLLGKPVESTQDIVEGAQALLEKGIRRVVVSLGAKGALFAKEGQMLVAQNLPVEVKSTVGAGDSLLAAFAWCHTKGMDWEESARWAMATANAKVTCEGSGPPERSQIEKYYHQIHCRIL